MDGITAFQEFVSESGGRAAAAKRIGITVGMVGHVLGGVRNLSVSRAIAIEAATAGRITRAELRPDVFGTPNFPRNEPSANPAEREHTHADANENGHVRRGGTD